MTNLEYFLYCLSKDMIYKLGWYYTVMTFHKPMFKNEYLKIEGSKYFVVIDDQFVEITNVNTTRPLLKYDDKITIDSTYLPNIDSSVNTNIGICVANKLLISDNFNNKIPYINRKFKTADVEKQIALNMHNVDIISVEEYEKYVDAASFLKGTSRITTVAATERTMVAPKDIEAFKKKTFEEFNLKYGTTWINDRSKIVEFENILKAYDSEWLKGDPTDGNLMSGKVKDNARSKMYLTFGAEFGFDTKGNNPKLVYNSLSEGYPEDVELLTTMFNTSRSGSYLRGKETQKGGADAKDVLRATSSITIVDGDCGSQIGKYILITNDNYEKMIGRYMFTNTKNRDGKNYIPIKDAKELIGKVIEIRSPQYCKIHGSSFCSVCAGEVQSQYKTGISLSVTDITGDLLNTSMKAMHGKPVKTIVFNPLDAIF